LPIETAVAEDVIIVTDSVEDKFVSPKNLGKQITITTENPKTELTMPELAARPVSTSLSFLKKDLGSKPVSPRYQQLDDSNAEMNSTKDI